MLGDVLLSSYMEDVVLNYYDPRSKSGRSLLPCPPALYNGRCNKWKLWQLAHAEIEATDYEKILLKPLYPKTDKKGKSIMDWQISDADTIELILHGCTQVKISYMRNYDIIVKGELAGVIQSGKRNDFIEKVELFLAEYMNASVAQLQQFQDFKMSLTKPWKGCFGTEIHENKKLKSYIEDIPLIICPSVSQNIT